MLERVEILSESEARHLAAVTVRVYGPARAFAAILAGFLEGGEWWANRASKADFLREIALFAALAGVPQEIFDEFLRNPNPSDDSWRAVIGILRDRVGDTADFLGDFDVIEVSPEVDGLDAGDPATAPGQTAAVHGGTAAAPGEPAAAPAGAAGEPAAAPAGDEDPLSQEALQAFARAQLGLSTPPAAEPAGAAGEPAAEPAAAPAGRKSKRTPR